jgi:hypothetical protein
MYQPVYEGARKARLRSPAPEVTNRSLLVELAPTAHPRQFATGDHSGCSHAVDGMLPPRENRHELLMRSDPSRSDAGRARETKGFLDAKSDAFDLRCNGQLEGVGPS